MADCRNLEGYLERAYVLIVYGGPVATLFATFWACPGPLHKDRAQR
jgi:hypothetical protein